MRLLSGGQRKMVGLARCLLSNPDILLLDEPDNHLDVERKSMLEQMIREFQGAVVIISHDRYLLDETVRLIVEIEPLGSGANTRGARLLHWRQLLIIRHPEGAGQFAPAARLYSSAKALILRHGVIGATLADINPLGVTPTQFENCRRHEAVVQHHIGLLHQTQGTEGQQVGITRPGAYQIHLTGRHGCIADFTPLFAFKLQMEL